MSTLPDPTVTLFLGLPYSGGNFFVLNDPVKGVLDNTTYLLAGDLGTNISASAYDIQIRRGTTTPTEQPDIGTATVSFRNYDRRFDPLNTASPLYGTLGPGQQVQVDMYGERLFAGYTDDWFNSYDISGEAIGSFPCIDGLGVLGRQSFDAWTTTPGQQAGARLADILNRLEVAWPGGLRSLATGVNTLVGDNVTWGSNPFNYCQLVAESDYGVVFVDRFGVFTYRDRTALLDPVPVKTFTDEGWGIPFSTAELTGAGERFYNQVSVDADGGTVQTSSVDTVTMSTPIRRLALSGLLMDSDAQALALADWLRGLYSQPIPRIKSIGVNFAAMRDADQPSVARLDVSDVVRVRWTPLGTGSTIDESYSIVGLEHSIPFDSPHFATYWLAPITQSVVFILDNATFGLLDGVGRLAF